MFGVTVGNQDPGSKVRTSRCSRIIRAASGIVSLLVILPPGHGASYGNRTNGHHDINVPPTFRKETQESGTDSVKRP